MTGWSTDRIAEQYRAEVRGRFEAENAEWLAHERAAQAKIRAECDAEGRPHPDWMVERNSFYWDIITASVIEIDMNAVRVVLPSGYAIYPDFIEMFCGTTVGWSKPSIGAEIADGEPRVVVELILVDYWDDEREAKWLARGSQP